MIGLYINLTYIAIRLKQYTVLAKTKLYQAITKGVIQVGGGFLGFGAIMLILGNIGGQSGGVITIINFLRKRLDEFSVNLRAISYKSINEQLVKYIKLSKIFCFIWLFE